MFFIAQCYLKGLTFAFWFGDGSDNSLTWFFSVTSSKWQELFPVTFLFWPDDDRLGTPNMLPIFNF
jgi:hypothetical protein